MSLEHQGHEQVLLVLKMAQQMLLQCQKGLLDLCTHVIRQIAMRHAIPDRSLAWKA